MTSLLPNLGLLRHQLESATPPDDFRRTYFQLELLPYSLGATYQALQDFVEAERELVHATIADPAQLKMILTVGAGGRDKLSYRIDTFLEAARRTQNAVIPYISKALSVSLPMSMDDLIGRLESGNPPALPREMSAVLISYWTEHGKALKDYRDLSQHHALVASEVRLLPSPGGPLIYMTLPNNPEEKNAARLAFDYPEVHVYAYMLAQMQNLIRLCHIVSTALTELPAGDTRAVSSAIVFRTPLQLGQGATLRGQRLRTVEDVRAAMDQFVTSLGRL